MALSDFQGPRQNSTGALKHLVGEQIQKTFVDFNGHVWLIMGSGFALKFSGFDITAAAFEVMDPTATQAEVEKHRAALQEKITQLRHLAPGIDL